MKEVHIYLADGFEEIEALAPADLLRRADAEVTLISVNGGKTVTGARGVRVIADCVAGDIKTLPDMIVLPGGYPGYENLAKCSELEKTIAQMLKENRFVAAICGAPAAVLGAKGFLKDRRAVCYPGMEEELHCKEVLHDGVCTDGNVITAKSAGYAVEFSLTLVQQLFGTDKMKKISDGIVYHG